MGPNLLSTLTNPTLRLTPAEQLNDLFEFRPNLEFIRRSFLKAVWGAKSKAEIEAVIAPHLLEDQLSWYHAQSASIGELSLLRRVAESALFDALSDFAHVVSNFDATSFVAGPPSPPFEATVQANWKLMWSHYAQGHRGFGIEIKGSQLAFEFAKVKGSILGNVDYVSERPILTRLAPPQEEIALKEWLESIFLKKDICWKYENESRVIAPLYASTTVTFPDGEPMHLVKIPPHMIEAIHLGCKCRVNPLAIRQSLNQIGAESARVFKWGESSPANYDLTLEEVA